MGLLGQEGWTEAGGLTVPRETLEALRLMRPAEMKVAVQRMFPGSHLAHMRPRDIEILVNTACLRAGMGSMRALGQPGAALVPAGTVGAGERVALLPFRILGGDARAAPCPDPARAPRMARAAPRRRAARRKARAAPRRELFGMPWIQSVGIMAGIATGITMAVMALAAFFW